MLAWILAPLCIAQQPAIVPLPDLQDPTAVRAYVARREAALAPALKLIRQDEFAAALTALHGNLASYPDDLRVMIITADVARVAGKPEEALQLYQRCLQIPTEFTGIIHLGIVRTYADLGQWTQFNRERAVVRTLALEGDRTLSFEQGYIVEDRRNSGPHIEVLEFPSTDPAAVTRYRFMFLSSHPRGFTPSIDVESNPSDAATFAMEFPHQSAAHVRPFALVSYPDVSTRGLLKMYPNGEPPFEDIQSDVLALSATFAGKTGPPASAPTPDLHRPVYRSPPKTN